MEMSLERAITERAPLALLKAIVEGGADVNAPSSSPPLLLSLACAHEEAALLLLKHGADPHVRVDGKYPLLAAAEGGMQKAVKELIARGVSPLPPEGDSVSAFPFVVACRLGHYHVCELLLRKATHGVPTGSRAAARAAHKGSPGEAEVTCYICESKISRAVFPQHIYLCLIHHKVMQAHLCLPIQ